MNERLLFPIYDILEAWAAFAYSTPEVKPQHHALYQSIIQQCKVRRGLSRFQLSYQYGMQISGIGSKNTYLATLRDLETWGFITYTPGANAYKTPIVEAHFRESTENLLVIYRTSYWESTDSSTDHNKEVLKEKVKGEKEEELTCALAERDAAIAAGLLAEKKIAELEENLKKGRVLYRALKKEHDELKALHPVKPAARIKRPSGEQFSTDPLFLTFWDAFDNKKNRKRALAVWATLTAEQRQMAAEKAKPYALATPDLKFRRHPDHWLSEHNFADETLPVVAASIPPRNSNQPIVHRASYPLT